MIRKDTATLRWIYFHWALHALVDELRRTGFISDSRARALARVVAGMREIRQLQSN